MQLEYKEKVLDANQNFFKVVWSHPFLFIYFQNEKNRGTEIFEDPSMF